MSTSERRVDPKKKRIANLLYAGIAIAIVVGIGVMLANETEKASGAVDAAELKRNVGQDPYHYVVLDVRTPEEFAQGHIPFSMNVPKDTIERELRFLEPLMERQVVVVCSSGDGIAGGQTCGDAVPTLRRAGFRSVLVLSLGIDSWTQAGFELTKANDSPFELNK